MFEKTFINLQKPFKFHIRDKILGKRFEKIYRSYGCLKGVKYYLNTIVRLEIGSICSSSRERK